MTEPSETFKRRVEAELAPLRNHLEELRAELEALSVSENANNPATTKEGEEPA